MKRLILLLVLIAPALMADGIDHLYDKGAARANLSNVSGAVSLDLSQRVRAAWAEVTGNIYASGSARLEAGTAAAPAYSFAADTNTGIYSPAADTLGFGTNGNEKIRIDSTGNFGIGTTTPTLTYSGDHKALEIYAEGSNAAGVRLSNDNGANACMELVLTNIDESSIYTKGGPLLLWTGGVERMRITGDNGNVLIGTSTDDGANKLQVNGSMRLIGRAAPTPTEGGIYFDSTDKHLYVYNGTGWVQLDN